MKLNLVDISRAGLAYHELSVRRMLCGVAWQDQIDLLTRVREARWTSRCALCVLERRNLPIYGPVENF